MIPYQYLSPIFAAHPCLPLDILNNELMVEIKFNKDYTDSVDDGKINYNNNMI